ncbi:DUF3892 domain-containing protein [Arthrobacter sp. StoSoilB20]|uniref:DUF3892 domain-containing protein n=1 Tax=Arthrobacter sp. StoSoilB20 TaxID=2830995 RepID=UPI001CC6667C|nr:DUF3892 domain-containing protein [Arthrobacter sp. StoSoilB20]BCW58509.1 hypothetical protein StoSoilB20_18560 [Arthrobacter sp. StoSoilB20]
MAVRITHVHIEGYPEDHLHITSYKWINEADNNTGTSNKPTMVEWIDVKKGRAYVGTGSSKVEVGVVRPDNAAAYLRTYADGQWNNNLLALPRF